MAESESVPLLGKRGDFREVAQPDVPDTVACCCVESSRLAKVPVIKTVFRKRRPEEKNQFTSSFGVLLSMLGSVVGTGNIWRFPRIVANNATEGGALAFLIVWFGFLWLWSMPIILIEYGIGRFTKKSTVESYNKLIGPAYRFMGGFQAMVAFALGSYYSVLVGWCGYYFIHSCAQPLPISLQASNTTWNELQGSNWPVLCHGISILVAALSVSRGVATIEPVNKVIVPVLLGIVVFCFYWALFLPYASEGITHMFSPSFASMRSSKLWLDAISQNAWDTGAGLGTFLTYATFMKRNQGAVKLGSATPVMNNVVSLMCGMLIFSTVFSVQRELGQTKTQIVNTLQYNGPGNTGLTFIWMPLLFYSISGGRVLAIAFFLCLTLAGLSSLISLMELPIHILTDLNIKRLPATIFIGCTMFLLGTASAVDPIILVNQDSVWAYAMILSGCFLLFLVLRYGVLKFRKRLYNNYGVNDWPLPLVWAFVVVFVLPIEGIGLIIWWIVEEIVTNKSTWWLIETDTLATTLMEWAIILLVFIGLNWWMGPLKIYEPNNRHLKFILGLFFKLTPRRRFHSSEDKTIFITPDASTEEGKYKAHHLDESDEEKKTGSASIPMSPQRSRGNSLSSASPPPPPQPEEKRMIISDVEL